MAADLSRRYQSGERDLRAVLNAEADDKRRAAELALVTAASKQRASLGSLLTAYVDELHRSGKSSATQVEKSLIRNVERPWTDLWMKPAADVTLDEMIDVVARLANQGKLREAGKLRAYLRAAYAAAIRAKQDARAHSDLRSLNISSNPARELVPVDGATEARERVLSVAELRAYWHRIKTRPGENSAALRFHLLTGTQRITQLARLRTTDYDNDTETVRVRDSKGRRKAPRMYYVPITASAREAMMAMRGGTLGEFFFTVTAGETGAGYDTMRHGLGVVVEEMLEAKELEQGAFTLGDLRRTVETRLAALGVSKEIRAQLQSHGLGGVQDKHYDRYEYLKEKSEALSKLFQLLEPAKKRPVSETPRPKSRKESQAA
jgi:hypothetical protein